MRPEVHLGDLADDLVERRKHESVELDLTHRPIAAQRHADRGPDDARLGQRRIDHPVLPEVLLQSFGDPEHAAQLADVLTRQHHLRVGLQGPAQSGVEGLGHGHLHAVTSSKDGEVFGVGGLLFGQVRGLLGVDGVEQLDHRRLRQGEAPAAQGGRQFGGLRLDSREEVVVRVTVPGEVGPDPLDRILQPPVLELVGQPVLGRIVRRGVRAHPIRVRLDQGRPVAGAGPLQRRVVTACTASTSLPSTRTPGNPKPDARR